MEKKNNKKKTVSKSNVSLLRRMRRIVKQKRQKEILEKDKDGERKSRKKV